MPFVCVRGEIPDVVIVAAPEDFDPDGIGVQVDGETGEANNCWGDGIRGIPDDLIFIAEDETEGMCFEHMDYATWQQA